MKRTLIRLGLTALISSALFGCGGGSDGVSGSNSVVQVSPSTSASTIASNASTPTSASVQAWRALEPKITVTGVTINSPPVVSFAVTDATGAAVVGLGNQSQASTARLKSLTNLSFTLAKLVPATATEPSKWVSYLVIKPTTVAQAAGTVASTESCTADLKWCGTFPTTDREGTLVDNGDGTYKYTFARDIKLVKSIVDSLPNSGDGLKLKADLGDLTYDASLTHRVGIVVSGAAPGTGTNVPNATQVVPGTNIAIAGNLVYDFRPDGGAVSSTRSIVDISSCSSCHNGKGLAHGGSRKDPNLCVTCHTEQVKYGMSGEASRTGTALTGKTQNTTSVLEGRAIGQFPNLVHKVHMGAELKLSGYNYIPNGSGVGMNFNEVEWIQDPRNCTKCHNGADKTDINQATKTKDGDNWKNKPNQLACGACHDNISFAAAVPAGLTAHAGGVVTDGDASCASCHSAAGPAGGVDVAHRTEAPTANNPVPISGISAISYEIKSVSVDATTRQPKITFRILKDGVPFTAFATPTPTQATTGSIGVYSVPSTFEAIPGFRSGPTFYVAYAVPQDGIAAPADFNTYQSVALANLLVTSGHPKAGSIAPASNATDAANGYLTATLTGSSGQVLTATATAPTLACATKTITIGTTDYCANPSLIKIPTTAKLVTGAMIGNFTQVAFTSGDTAKLTTEYNPTNGTISKGLVIKTPLKKLAVSSSDARRVLVDTDKCESCHEQLGTAVDFHGGARNDGTSCAICHNPNRTSGGWSANASTFVHGIHAGTDPLSVTAAKATGTSVVGDPGSGRGGAGTAFGSGKRAIPFSWHRDKAPGVAGGFNAAAVVYPGILKRCDSCHVPNAVNFGASGATLLPRLLWTTSGTGKYNGAGDANKVFARDPVTGSVIYITADNAYDYGNVFSFTPEGSVVASYKPAVIVAPATTPTTGTATLVAAAGAGGVIVPADRETLVESPVTAACFACHDSSTAKLHFNQYGGVYYGKRKDSDLTFPTTGTYTGTLVNKETCLICHGMGRDQDAAAVHAK